MRRLAGILAHWMLIVLLVAADAARADDGRTLRLMPRPNVGAPDATVDSTLPGIWSAIAGFSLEPREITRTGAWIVDVPAFVPKAQILRAVKELRHQAGILWIDDRGGALGSSPGASTASLPVTLIAVRLAENAGADFGIGTRGAVRYRATDAVESPLPSAAFTVERIAATGHALLRLDAPVSRQAALRIAASLALRSGVRYAEPVGRVVVQKVPDDAQLSSQWTLGQGASGINATEAWDITTGGPVTVAVIDTGILPHPDLAGKILPGYDFVSDPDSARDGDGRDADPTDPGDASTTTDECGAKRSSWHGTFVAGIVAAATNNGIGVAGVSWGARILPVRVLGKCGGTFEDVVDGILWAGGVPVAGAPVNRFPARILNLSLGGETGGCPDYVQEAIDLVIARGAVPVIAAGNSHGDVYDESPAGCGGVVAVTAIDRNGDLASYSNAGAKADLGAPGGDTSAAPTQTLVLGLRNVGTDRAGAFAYGYGAGTSFAAPHVAGVLALMLTRNPGLTSGQMLNILFDSARSYRQGTRCSQLSAGCGAGIVDAKSALLATPDVHGQPSAPDLVTVVEFHNRDLQHYFMTASPVEIDAIDAGLAGPGWSRTGYAFRTFPITGAEEAMRPVCRFYGRPGRGPNSHFYSASAAECALLQAAGSAWIFEGWAFGVDLPQDGRCRPGYKALYRVYNQRAFANDANHRYLIDIYEYIRMQQAGWLPEGVVMCIVND